jgi:hypothetical protein
MRCSETGPRALVAIHASRRAGSLSLGRWTALFSNKRIFCISITMKVAAMKPIAIFVVLLFCVNIAAPQEQDGAKPDRWRGLILDESTPEDAIKLLGQPKKRCSGQSLRIRH